MGQWGGVSRAGSAALQAIQLQHSNAGRACLHLRHTKNS
jgi:hypothetical protein